MAINVGDIAPDFTLSDQTGNSITLSQFKGEKPVVLYFYPKDDTPGCTVESCAFRDSYEAFTEAGAVVIGISSDSPSSHAQFAAKHNLPFTLRYSVGRATDSACGMLASRRLPASA